MQNEKVGLIVVGIEGADEADGALRFAVGKARLRGAWHRVVTDWGSEWVRFVGINTPEISHEVSPVCFGNAADATRALLGGRTADDHVAAEAGDRYVRVLGYLTPASGAAAGRDVATTIAAAGAAR